MDNKLIILILGILLFFYLLQMNHTKHLGYNLNLKTKRKNGTTKAPFLYF